MREATLSEGFHENLRREEKDAGPSERSFGLTIGGVLTLIGLIKLYHAWPEISWRWAAWLLAAAIFGGLGALFPAPLRPLNRLWFRLGLLLHRVVTPVVMGLVFYCSVLPIGLVLRVMGKDLLRLRRDEAAQSYWIVRDPPGPARGTMKNQF
jgi:hypothetical protein